MFSLKMNLTVVLTASFLLRFLVSWRSELECYGNQFADLVWFWHLHSYCSLTLCAVEGPHMSTESTCLSSSCFEQFAWCVIYTLTPSDRLCYVWDKELDADQDGCRNRCLFKTESEARISEIRSTESRGKRVVNHKRYQNQRIRISD